MSSERKFYVYEHWRPDRGECFYVGKGSGDRSNSTIKRNQLHFKIVDKLLKLGLFVDVRIIKFNLTELEANFFERELIKFYGRKDLGTGPLSNLTDGGDREYNISPLTRIKMSIAKKGKTPHNKGKKASAISRKKMSDAQRGKTLTKEHAAKIGAALKGRTRDPAIGAKVAAKLKGRPHPVNEATKKKLSIANKGKILSESHRRRIGEAARKRHLAKSKGKPNG